ncbi:MAG: hypothetical protein OEM02_06235 [Desulfobulbaceae bacterium]|nr:hypothetical protein [Desulfobulbaceae bacterium]
MQLGKYFKNRSGEKVTKDMVPEFSEWTFYKTHRIKTGKMAVSEISEAPNGVEIQVDNGIYEFYIQGVAFGYDRRIARVRFLKQGSTPVLGEKIGETYSDLAQNSFYEPGPLADFINEESEKYYDWIEDITFDFEIFHVSIHEKKDDVKFYRFESGFGDGVFDVYKLEENGSTVGFEIEFIKDDEPYPFLDN